MFYQNLYLYGAYVVDHNSRLTTECVIKHLRKRLFEWYLTKPHTPTKQAETREEDLCITRLLSNSHYSLRNEISANYDLYVRHHV